MTRNGSLLEWLRRSISAFAMFFFPSPSLLAGSATDGSRKTERSALWNESSGLKIFLPIHRCERFSTGAPTRRLREVLPEVARASAAVADGEVRFVTEGRCEKYYTVAFDFE